MVKHQVTAAFDAKYPVMHVAMLEVNHNLFVVATRYEQFVQLLQVVDDRLVVPADSTFDVCGTDQIWSIGLHSGMPHTVLFGGNNWLKRMNIVV